MRSIWLNYSQSTTSWRMIRHPFVAVHDAVVALVAVGLMLMTVDYTMWYFVVAGTLFVTSAAYHWLPESGWRSRADQAAILLLVAGTPLPYVEAIVESGGAPVLLLLFTVPVIVGTIMLLTNMLTERILITQMLYGVVGILSVTSMLYVNDMPAAWFVLFWGGVGIYAWQFASYNFRWFNYYPNHFGYREVQHVMLSTAFILHATAAVVYV